MELIKKLKDIVGKENASNDISVLKAFSYDYSPSLSSMPDYVANPKDTKETQAIVKLANEEKIPLIPVSSGVHFYGTTIPANGGIIIDLRRMNRVLEIDKRNRKARIEPGVTWGKLQDELEKEGMTAFNPLLPHSEKSALTSLLEREPMLVPKFEYADPILTMEVVLPTGDILRTGSASVPGAPDNALADMVCPYGPGMDFFRLFQGAQGTLGIVTWMAIKIEHFSKLRKIYFIGSHDLSKIKEAAYRIQQLMIGNECFILNSLNLSLLLSENFAEDISSLKNKSPEFVLAICSAGALRRGEEKIAYEEEALKGVVSDLGLNLSESLHGYENIRDMVIPMLRKSWDKTETYWKNRVRGFCNEISFLTTFDKISMIKDVIFKISSGIGYDEKEIGIYLQPVEYGRACFCQFDFFYSDKNSSEFKKIEKLDLKIRKTLCEEGAHFSNPYGEWGKKVLEKAKPYNDTLKKIKKIFDPNGIMNPGRLYF